MATKTLTSFLSALLLAGAQLISHGAAPAPAASAPVDRYVTFHNDFYWTDTDGNRILTRSGALLQFNGTFYWYGGTTANNFHEQYCYTSADLVHWTNKGVILTCPVEANRIDVLYNESTKQYVMFLKYDGNGAYFGIATADKPEGPFTFKSQTLVDNARMGDMSIYKDTDGKAYLCYVSWATGTNAQHGIYRLSPDYLTLEKRLFLWDIKGREAPHIFKRNNIYYYGTSRTAGIQSSGTSYYTATNLEGPWSPPKPLPTGESKNSWDSQVDFVYPFVGTKPPLTSDTFYMFVGDRWTKDLPNGRNGDYIFLPMEFDGNDPKVDYYQDWELNVARGTWRKFDPTRNLALGKPATASSINGTNVAANVTDAATYKNYMTTKWESTASDPQWVQVDLGETKDVNRVILKWDTIAAKAFSIQISTDGQQWKDVFSTTIGGSYTVTDETFKTTQARYVRMQGTQRTPAQTGGRGGRGGRGGANAGQGGAAPPAAAPSGGYSLFDFEVLKD